MIAVIHRIRARQNDRSIATLAFLAAGMVFAGVNATLFLPPGDRRPDLVAVALACLVLAVAVVIAGERFSATASGILMVAAFLVVVPSVLLAPDRVRALNTALLFGPFFLYLVWFFPMWFARLLGYAWIGFVDLFILLRHGVEMSSVLLTLTTTGLLLGELIGLFKRRLERASLTDPLCDVWNSRGFARLLEREVAGSQRSGRPVTLLYLDLDDFKLINDRLGHSEGDRVLRDFATQMQDRCRPGDVFARFGGDEFALLLVDADADMAQTIAQRLHREIPTPGWSYGIAEWMPGESADAFISRADLGMLTSKRARKANDGGEAEHQAEAEPEPR